MKLIHNYILSKNNPEIDRAFHTNMSTLPRIPCIPFVVCSLKNNILCHPSSHQNHGHTSKTRETEKTIMMREKQMCIIIRRDTKNTTQRVVSLPMTITPCMYFFPCKSFTTGVTNNGPRKSKKIMQISLQERNLCNTEGIRRSIPFSMQKNGLNTQEKGYIQGIRVSTPKKGYKNTTKRDTYKERNTYTDYKQKICLKKKNLFQRKDNSCKSKTTNKIYSSRRKIKGTLGKLYISSTKNNTILTLIDTNGNTKGWSCSGSLGFKNARKSTTYAAQAAAESIVKKAKILGYTHLRLLVKGLGRGKQSCLRALSKSQLKIISLQDQTGISYNGCRASKKRRV